MLSTATDASGASPIRRNLADNDPDTHQETVTVRNTRAGRGSCGHGNSPVDGPRANVTRFRWFVDGGSDQQYVVK